MKNTNSNKIGLVLSGLVVAQALASMCTLAEVTPTLRYSRSGDQLVLTFTGTLYKSLDGVTWTVTGIESAESPYAVDIPKTGVCFYCTVGDSQPEPGKPWTIVLGDEIGLELNYIQPGTFTMGSPEDELGRYDDETQHSVTLTQGYWLGKYEVTQAQWNVLMGSNPSYFKGENLPVEQVSWNDIMGSDGFCAKLNAQERAAGRLPEGYVYTLPTEAQWEYACRAGTTTALNSGKNLTSIDICPNMNEVGWYWYNGGQENHNSGAICTHPVGQKAPNAWGLYDMHGNVWEWCSDWYGGYPIGAVSDPTGSTTGSSRVMRGGAWAYLADDCRSALRLDYHPDFNINYGGFRLALSLVK